MPKTRTVSKARDRLSVVAFAGFLLVLYIGLAFAAGWLVGKEFL
jgi:hypothetical protein